MNPTHTETAGLESGPLLGEPEATLGLWFEANAAAGERRIRLRIPVVVTAPPDASPGSRGAVLARPAGAAPLAVDLDDSALGISLCDRLRSLCPGSGECALWLEGYWGSLVELPGTGQAPRAIPFAVLEVGPLLDAEEREAGRLRLWRRRP